MPPLRSSAGRAGVATIAPGRARVVLAFVAAVLILVSLAATRGAEPLPAEQSATTIHAGLVDAVLSGGDYYIAAAEALRGAGRPADPLAIRLPTLTTIAAIVPLRLTTLFLGLLALATVMVWRDRLAPAGATLTERSAALLLPLAGAVAVLLRPEAALLHEAWAGLAIALSLGLRRSGRLIETIAMGLVAALILQLAGLYLAVMALFAIAERRREEALGWGAALAVFAIVLAAHVRAAIGAGAGDLLAEGSSAAGLIAALRSVAAATPLPMTLAAPLAVLALAGWIVRRGETGSRVAVVLVGFLLLAARAPAADVGDAAQLAVPLLPVGLIFAAAALRDLVRAAIDTRRITVRRVTR